MKTEMRYKCHIFIMIAFSSSIAECNVVIVTGSSSESQAFKTSIQKLYYISQNVPKLYNAVGVKSANAHTHSGRRVS